MVSFNNSKIFGPTICFFFSPRSATRWQHDAGTGMDGTRILATEAKFSGAFRTGGRPHREQHVDTMAADEAPGSADRRPRTEISHREAPVGSRSCPLEKKFVSRATASSDCVG